MKNVALSFILLLFSFSSYSQTFQEEKPFSIIISGLGGAGFINYNFTNNNPTPSYYQPEQTSAVLWELPLKVNLLFHHRAFHIGGGLDRRDINFGVGVKRQSLSGEYYDYLYGEYKKVNSILLKLYGRGELMIIQHERGDKVSGFGGFLEGGSLSVSHPVGTRASGGFGLGFGGFYFGHITHNFFITLELATNYDRYKSYVNNDLSTHNLFSNEIMLGLRVVL
jgi:hypothetical protein